MSPHSFLHARARVAGAARRGTIILGAAYPGSVGISYFLPVAGLLVHTSTRWARFSIASAPVVGLTCLLPDVGGNLCVRRDNSVSSSLCGPDMYLEQRDG